MKHRLMIAALLVIGYSIPARAESSPQGTLLDTRVRTLVFNENQVYRITAYYGYQIDIELADNEDVRTVAAGDTVGWQIVSAGAHLFIKPMAANARTNLSVITNRRTYLFDLTAESVKNPSDMAYLVRFKYPQNNIILSTRSSGALDTGNPAGFNFDYKIKGTKSIRPTRVFDDGLFTFFQFASARKQDLPAIFWVSPDGQESLINYRMDGSYVVVERIGEQFILRSGSDRVTVTNKREPDPVQGPDAGTN